MQDILQALLQAVENGQPVACTALVETRGSTPQKAGAAMLVFPDGSQVGTLGGGCVEAEVKRRALRLLDEGHAELLTFQLDNDYGWDDGLICGGRMKMLVDPVHPGADLSYFREYLRLLRDGLGCTEAIVIDATKAGGGHDADRHLLDESGRVVSSRPVDGPDGRPVEAGEGKAGDGSHAPVPESQTPVAAGPVPDSPAPDSRADESRIDASSGAHVESGGGSVESGRAGVPNSLMTALKPIADRPRPYVDSGLSFLPQLEHCRLLIVGAGHVGQKVAELASNVDFNVWVVDDREQYCNPERFPSAERLIVGPIDSALSGLEIDRNTMCVIVTRGHNHDEEALYHLAETPARYVGMIGSRRKIRLIFDDLLQEGVSRERLERVHAPLGFDIGSQTVAEIAISIVAELIAHRNLGRIPDRSRPGSVLSEPAPVAECG